jgi:lipopolysaccharide transport system ATP-binding protein
MRNFSERGGTLLLVSHDPSAHIALCSEVIMLHEGQIIRSGEAKTVLDYYNAFIAKETEKPNISQKVNKDGKASLRSGSLDLTFNDIVLENSKGEECEKFTTGEYCVIKSNLIAKKNIDEATIGILIRDLFGRDVFATNTNLQGLESLTMETGEHRSLEIKLKLDIGPGRYTITVAAHKGKIHTEGNYDWIDDCLIVDISPPVPMKFSGIAPMDVDFKY